MSRATVIGAGLAGCEAALQLARAGVEVTLIEQKPARRSPAHHADTFAELVCSNSLKARRLESAAGLLKEEMRRLGSICVESALQCSVAAGGALAVDREAFSALITLAVRQHPNIHVVCGECEAIPEEGICVVATGPLTDGALSQDIARRLGRGYLSFYDAAAPIVTAESVDMTSAFAASRYERGEGDGDYLNCPMNREEYEIFYDALVTAERVELKEFERAQANDCAVPGDSSQPQQQKAEPTVYEGCMPIEIMARRGKDTIRFGPLKPVGLRDPRTGHRPWAVVQLRRENAAGSLYNLVGFQTNLKFSEQKRVFSLIPALHDAEFMRYGVMHRNTFLDSPRLLDASYALRDDSRIFFAGQITGVEGYMESASSGILAGLNAARALADQPPFVPPRTTMMGALCRYISDPGVKDFQPMGANFGVLPPLEAHIRDKRERYGALAARALEDLERTMREAGLSAVVGTRVEQEI